MNIVNIYFGSHFNVYLNIYIFFNYNNIQRLCLGWASLDFFSDFVYFDIY